VRTCHIGLSFPPTRTRPRRVALSPKSEKPQTECSGEVSEPLGGSWAAPPFFSGAPFPLFVFTFCDLHRQRQQQHTPPLSWIHCSMRWILRSLRCRSQACKNGTHATAASGTARRGERAFQNQNLSKTFSPLFLQNILDFKQVFQFDSPQIFQILKNFRKMQTRFQIVRFKFLKFS